MEGATIPAAGEVRRLVAGLLEGRVVVIGSGLLLLLLGNSAGVGLPIVAKWLIDHSGVGQYSRLLWQLSALVLAAATLQAAGKYFSARMVSVGAQQSIARLRTRLHAHALSLPMRYFHTTPVGVIATRVMHDVDAIRLLLGSGLLQIVGAVFTSVLALAAMFWLHWRLTLSVLLVLLSVGLLLAGLFARSRPLLRQRAATMSELSGRCTEAFTAIRLIKAYGTETMVQRDFAQRNSGLFEGIRESLHVASLMSVVTVIAIALLMVVTIQIGGHAIMAGTLSPGGMMAYVVLVGLLASPLATVANQGPELGEALHGLERISRFLAIPADLSVSAPEREQSAVLGRIEFLDVHFAYEPGQPILDGVSFTIPAGSLTVIVGLSGAGKSTVLSLLMGLERPQSGQILVDNQNLQSLDSTAYRCQLGVVLQDDYLFDGTLLDNVRFGAEHATTAEVENACRCAFVLDFCERLPDGLHSRVGVGGFSLSGGQRQRVAIARAMLRNPAIMILDEATSHLDEHSESMVQAGLQSLQAGRTSVVVGHRPGTIKRADQILALENGRIREV